MGVSINGDIPKWLVFVRENPTKKWMMTGGTPIYGNHHIYMCSRPDAAPRPGETSSGPSGKPGPLKRGDICCSMGQARLSGS